MKNIGHLMVASNGHGTTTNSAAQQQNLRHNHQHYGFTAKATVRQNEKATAYFLSPLSPCLPSLSPCPPHSPSLYLSLLLWKAICIE